MSSMKIIIKFNKKLTLKYKERIKMTLYRDNFNENIMTAIDNGKGLNIVNTFGQWVYKIRIKK